MPKLKRILSSFASASLLGMLGFAAQAEAVVDIKLGLASGSIPSSIPRVANELGLFEKHGLNVDFVAMQSASTVTSALLSGSVDFMTTSTPEPIFANARGQKIRTISALYNGFAAVIVLDNDVVEASGVSPDAPLEERLKVLDGLTLASVSATSNFTIGLHCAAEKAGAKVNMTYLEMPSMVAALSRGAVNGFVATAPYYAISDMAGEGVPWVNGPKGEFPAGCSVGYALGLHTMEDYAKQNPEVIARIRAVFAEFSEVAKAEPETVKAALKTLYPDIDAALIDVIYETEAFGFAGAALTVEGMRNEIEFIKLGETTVQGLDTVDPAVLILP